MVSIYIIVASLQNVNANPNFFCRRGLDYSTFEIVFGYLSVEECHSGFGRVCRQWRHLNHRMFYSYSSSLRSIDNSQLTSHGLRIILDKGSRLAHVRMLGDILRRDFRNQVKFFNQNIVMQARVADRLFSQGGNAIYSNQGRLFQSFKIKTQAINSNNNFISSNSLVKLCQKSCASLQDVCIRNGDRLSNESLIIGLSMLKGL